jgi:Fe-S cluster assembly protein SufD
VITVIEQLETYLATFDDFQKTAPGRDLAWLKKLREDAFARFAETGFPTTKDEDWRFTNVAPIAKTSFALAKPVEMSSDDLQAYAIFGAACQLVFVNGHFQPNLSRFFHLPLGVEVTSLAEAIRTNPQTVEQHLGRYLNTERDAFAALNTAFLNDGAYVHIGRGNVLELPIHLLFVTTNSDLAVMTHPPQLDRR